MKLTNETVKQLKKDFPILQTKVNNKPLVYLDNTATTQKPKAVIEAIKNFYETTNANIHRGVYPLSEEATNLYEQAHEITAKFINAQKEEIIFTRSTTESLNLLSYSLPSIIKKGNTIVVTAMEHHSNLVPWQQLAKRNNLKLEIIKLKDDFTLDYEDAEKKINENTAILSINHISNSLGTINDIKTLIELGKQHKAITIVDAAQSIPHQKIDVKELDCDFLAFSGHKMLAPTGIGVLYGKKELLEKLQPFNFGGDMISKVTYQDAEWNNIPMKFEAGTPNIAGAIGLAAAIQYLENIGLENIQAWESHLTEMALQELKRDSDITIYNPGENKSAGIISFNIKGTHAHDVASILGDEGICIRGGHHCNMPLMHSLNIQGTSRASFALYNTEEDVQAFIQAIKKTKEILL